MLTLGDVLDLDLEPPEGAEEAGFRHSAVVVTAQWILDAQPTVIDVVPLTTIRAFTSEIRVRSEDANGLRQISAAQSQHVRAGSTRRVEHVRGDVGSTVLTQIRDPRSA
nr:hypothetical protein [uncultured bacterium]